MLKLLMVLAAVVALPSSVRADVFPLPGNNAACEGRPGVGAWAINVGKWAETDRLWAENSVLWSSNNVAAWTQPNVAAWSRDNEANWTRENEALWTAPNEAVWSEPNVAAWSPDNVAVWTERNIADWEAQQNFTGTWTEPNIAAWTGPNEAAWTEENVANWNRSNVAVWTGPNEALWSAPNVAVWSENNIALWTPQNMASWTNQAWLATASTNASTVGAGGWNAVNSLWTGDRAVSGATVFDGWSALWTANEASWEARKLEDPQPLAAINGAWSNMKANWQQLNTDYNGQGARWMNANALWAENAEQTALWERNANPSEALSGGWVWTTSKFTWEAVGSTWNTTEWAADANVAQWARRDTSDQKIDRVWTDFVSSWERQCAKNQKSCTADVQADWARRSGGWDNFEAQWENSERAWVNNVATWSGWAPNWVLATNDWLRSDGSWQGVNLNDWTSDQRLAGGWLGTENVWASVDKGVWATTDRFWTSDANRSAVFNVWNTLCPVNRLQ